MALRGGYGGWTEADEANLNTLADTINGGGEVFFVVPGYARGHA